MRPSSGGHAAKWIAAGILTAVFAQPAASEAQTGRLVQLSGSAACWNQNGDVPCTDGNGLGGTTGVVVSSDGRHVYTSGAQVLAEFSRDTDTGALTQLSGVNACVGYGGGCWSPYFLGSSDTLELSPDGRFLYVASFPHDAIALFVRNSFTGGLGQANDSSVCIGEFQPACTVGRSLGGVRGMAMSPRGEHLYVASPGDDAIGVFLSNELTGSLTQMPGVEGCIREGGGDGCATGRSLADLTQLAVSRDGRNVYTASPSGDAVAVFSRDRTTGGLTQAAGTEGCVNLTGANGCATASGLDGATGVAVSRDGRHVYVASRVDGALTTFSRDRKTGALTFAGCIREGGGAPCTAGTKLAGAEHVRLTRDGRSVYVVSEDGHSIAVFARDRKEGTLAQLEGLDGCLSADASGPCVLGHAMTFPGPLAIDKRGSSVYLPSWGANAVSVFERLRK